MPPLNSLIRKLLAEETICTQWGFGYQMDSVRSGTNQLKSIQRYELYKITYSADWEEEYTTLLTVDDIGFCHGHSRSF